MMMSRGYLLLSLVSFVFSHGGHVDGKRRINRASCDPERSTKVNGRVECTSNKLIFSDDFNDIDTTKWQQEVRFADDDEHEFVLYDNRNENYFITNGIIYMKPTLLEDVYGDDFVRSGAIKLDTFPSRCTNPIGNKSCSRKANGGFMILPPVISARMRTYRTFSFRYGTVELRAKLPFGDWIYPQILLSSKGGSYGLGPVEIVIAQTRGNRELYLSEEEKKINFGKPWIEAGVTVSSYNPKTSKFMVATVKKEPKWHNDYHIYKMTWTPDSIRFTVDNELIGVGEVTPPAEGFIPGNHSSKMAPFDEEFYLVLGVGVGGIQHFPDGVVTVDNHVKPWKNLSPKGTLKFWEDKENWYKTWQGNSTCLKVSYIKVWSL